jgi:hypothetical protein
MTLREFKVLSSYRANIIDERIISRSRWQEPYARFSRVDRTRELVMRQSAPVWQFSKIVVRVETKRIAAKFLAMILEHS